MLEFFCPSSFPISQKTQRAASRGSPGAQAQPHTWRIDTSVSSEGAQFTVPLIMGLFFSPTRKDLDYESSDEIEQYAVPMEPRPCQAAPARPRT